MLQYDLGDSIYILDIVPIVNDDEDVNFMFYRKDTSENTMYMRKVDFLQQRDSEEFEVSSGRISIPSNVSNLKQYMT